ncbi:MAG: MarR family transcriptional regulator [Chloroflexota bacterium]|nr:MarR family transcriptional regulator [Chloroflexota bacterium]
MRSTTVLAAAEPEALPEDEVDQIVRSYRHAGRKLRAADPRDWAAGLSMPQLRVLFFLGRLGPSSVGEVAAGMAVSQPSATETLDRLVRAGLVERTSDSSDRRVVRNALTTVGREMIDRPWETRRAVLASALRDATPADRATIARGLELLCRALDDTVDELPPEN